MSKNATAIANVVARIFRQQKQSGRERFGDWNSRLATVLLQSLAPSYVAGMKRAKATDIDWAANAAKIQAQEAAAQINEATTNMLDASRDIREVFSSDRAALIGLDQYDKAIAACEAHGAKERGTRLEWVVDSSPCSRICRKLAGKIRRPGKVFVIVDGVPIFGPPAHLH